MTVKEQMNDLEAVFEAGSKETLNEFEDYVKGLSNRKFLAVAKAFTIKRDSKFAVVITDVLHDMSMTDKAIKCYMFQNSSILQFLAEECLRRDLVKKN